MQSDTVNSRSASLLTRGLLACGIAAGPLYIIVGLAQALTREGFDVRRHALSLLSNGELGWIQVSNFLVVGALVIAGALGTRRALFPGRGATWGPVLLAVYGVGLIGGGIFPPDPALGFPPGTPPGATSISRSGLLHFIFGGIGFYALIGACFVFARRFARLQQRGWTVYSSFTGAVFFLAFGAIASGAGSPVVILGFYAAVAWIWVWHAALHLKLLNGRVAGSHEPRHGLPAGQA